jgi:soluble lytic murein transglycosylase-like protein
MSKIQTVIVMILLAMFMSCNSRAETTAIAGHIRKVSNGSVKQPELIALMIVKSATKYGIDPMVYASIIATESMYRSGAVNYKSSDYGIAQINKYTAKAYKLNLQRLKYDAQYNLDAGAMILSYMKGRFAKTEPTTWICRYNVGTRALEGARLEACIKYLSKVNYYLGE